MQTAISALVFALLLGSTTFAGGPVVVVEDDLHGRLALAEDVVLRRR